MKETVEQLAKEVSELPQYRNIVGVRTGFVLGYNKSQESHPFSEGDMIEFAEFMFSVCKEYQRGGTYVVTKPLDDSKTYTVKELLQLWKQQKTKTVYYE